MTTGMPPMWSMSFMTKLPKGLTSARCGTFAPMRRKSSIVRSTSASCAMASRCSTALVEPPKAMTTAMAFSNAGFVMMSRAVMPRAEQLDDSLARLAGVHVAAAVGRGRRGRAGDRHADRLGDGGHRVGGVEAAAGALARADRPLDGVDVLERHQSGGARPDGLEGVDDRDLLLGAVGELGDAREDRAGIEEDGGQVEARGGHEHARAATCRNRRAALSRRGARRS